MMALPERRVLGLTPFDQTIARVYINKVLVFPFPDANRQDEATRRLREGLAATTLKWPWVAGMVRPVASDKQKNLAELAYSVPASSVLRPDLFTVKRLEWSYSALSDAGVPPSVIDKHLLSPMPVYPTLNGTWPAFAMQANFIDGGLLLCMAFHHAVFDGSTGRLFFQAFGDAMRTGNLNPGIDHASLDRQLQISCGSVTDAFIAPSVEHLPVYDFTDRPRLARPSTPCVGRILTFTAAEVQRLKNEVSKLVSAEHGDKTFVSTNDCVCALIWTAVMTARRPRLSADAVAKFSFAVGTRAKIEPKLPATYTGNAMVNVVALAPIDDLQADAETGIIAPATLALAALEIRRALQSVDAAYVQSRLELFRRLPDPQAVDAAHKRAIDMPDSGLDCSSWRDQIAGIDFGIPGASPAPRWFRKTYSVTPGSCNILCRTGPDKEADWEVALVLSCEDMEKVCSAALLGPWLARVA